MSSFKNYFNEQINLEEDWRVALSEIIFPAKINQVNKSDLKIFSSEGLKFYEKSIPFDAVSRPYGGERAIIGIGSYENRDYFLRSLKTASGLPHFDYQINKINGVLFLFLVKTKELLFRITKFQISQVSTVFMMGLVIILDTKCWTLLKI